MGEELINSDNRNAKYKSGRWEDISIDHGMAYQEFVARACVMIPLLGQFQESYVRPWMRYKHHNLMDFLTHVLNRAPRVIQIHTFRNIHNQSIEDVSFGQPAVHTKRGGRMVDDVIRGSPDYLPRQLFIDSSHMSGPYKGALFSTSSYDVDDGLFPITYVAYARLECDYLVAMEMLRMFNPELAKWVEEVSLSKLGKCRESHVIMLVQQFVDLD
ncbi:hypothetical protein CK203_104955 [Vitis vinifera]|uniref:Uncharacterized protein n=1 Tax=Vitis vinifera TaxID=29760 RepID=A0A438BQJ7_VITVI|nr:hypothetical protein CK203_104955 [Vitis vinifera]